MSADELEVEFDPKKIKKIDDDLDAVEVPVAVDDETETLESDEEEGVLEEELNPFGDRWEE